MTLCRGGGEEVPKINTKSRNGVDRQEKLSFSVLQFRLYSSKLVKRSMIMGWRVTQKALQSSSIRFCFTLKIAQKLRFGTGKAVIHPLPNKPRLISWWNGKVDGPLIKLYPDFQSFHYIAWQWQNCFFGTALKLTSDNHIVINYHSRHSTLLGQFHSTRSDVVKLSKSQSNEQFIGGLLAVASFISV